MDRMKTIEDICMHEGEHNRKFLGAVVPPIFQNSLFTHEPGTAAEYVYTRDNNPTTQIAEKKIAALEGAEDAACFSTGMAAITSAIMSCIKKDGHVISIGNIYSGTRCFLEGYLTKFGVKTTFVSGEDTIQIEDSINKDTTLIMLESPSSLLFTIQDIRAVTAIAKSRGIKTIIDNTWSTPLYQNPLQMGADIVVHSASKYLGGHSDIVGGAAAGSAEIIKGLVKNERMLLGACMDPHQSWLLIRGLRTLPIRMKQHYESAIRIAQFLHDHHATASIFYPGLRTHPQFDLAESQQTGHSGLMSFMLKDMSISNIKKFFASLKLFQFGQSWGGFESLAIPVRARAYTKYHKELAGECDCLDLIRISAGLENIDSILQALDDALNTVKS